MPPKKELCRNYARGTCRYGADCRFLHPAQQQPKPNSFGFGLQSGTQFQRPNQQQQQPNPFGFGVQGAQPRGATQNQFKPFENKWTRSSATNTASTQASRQPDNQPSTANHKCTDPESCKRQITEDFQNEKPLWKLTCYGHSKSTLCDISGDISPEELRAAAYDDAKKGMSMQSIVERERNLVNTKLAEFQSLLRNPYVIKQSSSLASQTAVPGANPVAPLMTESSTPPTVSSFSQLGGSLNGGFAMRASPLNTAFGSFPTPNMGGSIFGANNSPSGGFGSQAPVPSFGSPFVSNTSSFNNNPVPSFGISPVSNTSSFNNNAFGGGQNAISIPAVSPQISAAGSVQATFPSGSKISQAAGQLSSKTDSGSNNTPNKSGTMDNSIWLKEQWIPGEIPEEIPPDEYIF